MPISEQPDHSILKLKFMIEKDRPKYLLDIGAGESAKWGKILQHTISKIDAIEVFTPHIETIKKLNIYQNVYNYNVMDFIKTNEYIETAYDSAILGDILEHLKKPQALELIECLKNKVNYIYLIIPTCVCIQGEVDGNKYEIHRYHWSDKEVRDEIGMKLIEFGLSEDRQIVIGTYMWSSV
jgi:hypothetical protein